MDQHPHEQQPHHQHEATEPAWHPIPDGGIPGIAQQPAAPTAPAHHHPAAPDVVAALGQQATTLRPVPVVRVLSPVGVEYVFMILSLFTGALGLASALISLVNGKFDFSVLAFPTALLVVGVPAFAGIFLHLKKLEILNPELKLDPSKRRSTQAAQILSFLVSLFTLVGLVFAVFAKLGGQSSVSIGKALLDALCILVVSGGILAYYWLDEHKG